jgi:anti-anti-sigma factor
MNINSHFSAQDDTLKIRISGQFTHAVHPEFTQAYKTLPASSRRKYVIDLSATEYMDSAALGMLLVLRERSGGEQAKITLSGARNDVAKILDISGFKELFTFA